MTEIKPLPREIVEKLEEAGISRENKIFYHQHQWVYQKKLASMTDFPHCGHPIDELGPFDVHSVDVSMVLSPVKSRYTVTRVGHTKLAEQDQPIGTHSPLAEITLEGFARSTADIPDNATHFCWLYPPRRLPVLDELQTASFEEINLLKIGGFAYFVFDRDSAEPLQLVRINSLIVTGKNGIVFDGPFIWNSNYNDQLWSQNRFHPVTLPSLREKGARYFAFINPSESFSTLTDPAPWIPSPNGAFIYLFNDSHLPNPYDCYFSVADSCLGVAANDE